MSVRSRTTGTHPGEGVIALILENPLRRGSLQRLPTSREAQGQERGLPGLPGAAQGSFHPFSAKNPKSALILSKEATMPGIKSQRHKTAPESWFQRELRYSLETLLSGPAFRCLRTVISNSVHPFLTGHGFVPC